MMRPMRRYQAAVILLVAMLAGCVPPTPETPTGPRTILIWYETSQATPQWAATITDLRAGESQKYLASQNHLMLILDDDLTIQTTRKDVQAAIEAARKQGAPAIVAVDSSGGSVIASARCDLTWTGPQIIDLIKKAGG